MSHWYSHDGTLHAVVEYKDPKRAGQYRDMTFADARPLGYLPGVTTVLQILNRPGLNKWLVMQGIEATIEHPDLTVEELFLKSQEYVRWTADFGTAVHWWVSYKLRAIETLEIPPIIPGAEEVAQGLVDWFEPNGYEFTLTEHRFARPDLGYAGTADLLGTHYGVPCVVDVKTQEPPLTPHEPDYPLQLAGYDSALESGVRERISIIANRDKPGDVLQYLWVDKGSTVQDTNNRYDKLWLNLLELWFGLNLYDPRTGG